MESKLSTGLGRLATYRYDGRLLVASFCLTAASFVVYARYFDILAPFIPGGSVRANSGPFFALPVFLLLSAQTLFTTFLTHLSIGAVDGESKDALKAFFVASAEILLYSAFYVFFPFYGPYTYVVYFMPNESFGPLSYPILVVWTLVTIVVTAVLTRRIFRLENPRFGMLKSLLLAATTLAVIMAMAD